MNKITHQLNKLARKDKSHSFSTRSDRARQLRFFGDAVDSEFRKLDLQNLSQRHLDWFLAEYRAGRLSANGHAPTPGTVKNILAAIRWALHRVGKMGLLAPDNASLGIPKRSYVATTSRATRISDEAINELDRRNPWYGASVRLMQSFGLRVEESLKCVPTIAYAKFELRLEGSWCKNGKSRAVPIRTRDQVTAIHHALRIAGDSSLVPAGRSYIQAKRELMNVCAEMGLSHRHGLRHAYAQDTYSMLAGFACPLADGPLREGMTLAQRRIDLNVRIQISTELGHERPAITRAYLGTATPKSPTAPSKRVDLYDLLG